MGIVPGDALKVIKDAVAPLDSQSREGAKEIAVVIHDSLRGRDGLKGPSNLLG